MDITQSDAQFDFARAFSQTSTPYFGEESDVFLREEDLLTPSTDVSSSAVVEGDDLIDSFFDTYSPHILDGETSIEDFTESSEDIFNMENMEQSNYLDNCSPLHSILSVGSPEEPKTIVYENIVIPPPLLMSNSDATQQQVPSAAPKKSLRRISRNRSRSPPLLKAQQPLIENKQDKVPVLPPAIKIAPKPSVASTTISSKKSSPTTVTSGKPKPESTNKPITFCESEFTSNNKVLQKGEQGSQNAPVMIQFVSQNQTSNKGISKQMKMTAGWKFHQFDREKQPVRDSSGFTYHFYQPKQSKAGIVHE